MGDSLRYMDWFEKASQDLRGAEILMAHEGGNDLVAFHCQQAMEKTLKGWLLKNTGELLEGHSLVFLCRKAISSGAPLKNSLRDCAYVNQFYIETRYPADIPFDIDTDTIMELIHSASEMLSFITEIIHFDFRSYHKR